MKRVWIGFQIGLPTLLLVIATSLLSGCVKTDSVAKTRPSGNSVDDLFTPLNGGIPNASGMGVEKYAEQVRYAIQRNFYDANSYAGKQCNLRIQLAPDGMLLDVQAVDGDPALCRAAIKAIANTTFPKPPSQVVYSVFKNTVLEFRPLASE